MGGRKSDYRNRHGDGGRMGSRQSIRTDGNLGFKTGLTNWERGNSAKAEWLESTGRQNWNAAPPSVCQCGGVALYHWKGVGYCRKCLPERLP